VPAFTADGLATCVSALPAIQTWSGWAASGYFGSTKLNAGSVLSGAPFVNVGLESNCAVQPSETQVDPLFCQFATTTLPSNQTASFG
jgi:hypothetical protein